MVLSVETLTLAVIIGTLMAIVYSLRILVLLERRMAKMDLNIERVTKKILMEELKIERAEQSIARKLGAKKIRKKRK